MAPTKLRLKRGVIPDHIPEQNILKQAGLSLAIDEWMEKNECAASAVQCWTSIQENYGCATMRMIRSYLGEGDLTDDPFDMDGGIAVCRIRELRKLLFYMCHNGFEHHVAMTRGHCADVLHEAVTKYLGWDLYYHSMQL